MDACDESISILRQGGWALPDRVGNGPAGRRLRVWLVDDSRSFRELLAEVLAAEQGLDCARQFSSAEAVLEALARETPPDAILLDNQMGGMSGVEALRPLKRAAPATAVLLLTSSRDPRTKAEAFRNGASDFLTKDCTAREIADRLRRACASPASPAVEEQRLANGVASGAVATNRCREAAPAVAFGA